MRPTSPDEPPASAPGLWLLGSDEIVRAVHLGGEQSDIPADMACAPGEATGSERRCEPPPTGVLVLREGLDGRIGGRGICDCYLPRPRPPRRRPGNDYALVDHGVVSVVGGMAYSVIVGEGHERARGPFLSKLAIDLTTLRPSARTVAFPGAPRCFPGAPQQATTWSVGGPECGASTGEEGCGECARAPDTRLVLLQNAELHDIAIAQTTDGNRSTLVRTIAATPASCPSDADPCGPAAAFEGLGEVERYWVADDGSSVLVNAGKLEVRAPGRAEPLWRSAFGGTIVGVELHPDARALRDRLRAIGTR